MQSVWQALQAGAARLRAAQVEGAQKDARLLMAKALDISKERLILVLDQIIEKPIAAKFNGFIDRRAARVPMSYILGHRLFCGFTFAVNENVLDPRPETETLVQGALNLPFKNMLDLGTGSGCIALSLLKLRAHITADAVDICPKALAVARQNAQTLGVLKRVRFYCSDWFAALEGQKYDLITANPPYISKQEMAHLSAEVRAEPAIALSDFADGLTHYRTICRQSVQFLNRGGTLMVEVGHTQAKAVCALFEKAGFTNIETRPDMDGCARVVRGVLSTTEIITCL